VKPAVTEPIPTGDTAKVYSGIRDVPIYAGQASHGNRLPFGPYRWSELVAIGLIMGPALIWFNNTTDPKSRIVVLLIAAAASAVITALLRCGLPRRRPSLTARAQFAWNCLLPSHRCAGRPRRRR
jgi:hypothetical protein